MEVLLLIYIVTIIALIIVSDEYSQLYFNEQYDWKNHFVVITSEYNELFIQIDNERHQLIPVEENTFLVPDISLLIILPKKPRSTLIFLDENGDYSQVNKTYPKT